MTALTFVLIPPRASGQIIDLVAIKHDSRGFVIYTMWLLIASLVNAVFTGFRGSIFILCIARLNVRIRTKLFQSLVCLQLVRKCYECGMCVGVCGMSLQNRRTNLSQRQQQD